jgi:hypothetical protein
VEQRVAHEHRHEKKSRKTTLVIYMTNAYIEKLAQLLQPILSLVECLRFHAEAFAWEGDRHFGSVVLPKRTSAESALS